MKTRIAISALALLAAVGMNAQNGKLNQTVQVVNTYEGKVNDAQRMQTGILVPDSLYRFDLNFDYSGFDTPYRGNDEFNPYLTDLEMAARPFDGKKLYLKAGAGYVTAPVLDFAYTFAREQRFKMGAHAKGEGYYGFFRQIQGSDGVLMPVSGSSWLGPDSKPAAAYNAKLRAGFDGRADWQNTSTLFTVDYEGAFGSSAPNCLWASRRYNGVDLNAGVDWKFDVDRGWKFSMDLGYAFGYEENFPSGGRETAFEHNPRARAFFCYDFKNGSALDMDITANVTFNIPRQSLKNYVGYTVCAKPRYFFNSGKVFFGLGLGVMYDGGLNVLPSGGESLPLGLWPVLTFHWAAVKNVLDVYADADLGGEMYGARLDALENNFYIRSTEFANVRRYNITAGLRGNVSGKFDYDLSAGYKGVNNDPLFRCAADYTPVYVSQSLPGLSIVHQNTGNVFAKLALAGRFGGFSFDGKLHYRYYLKKEELVSVPSAVTASLDMKYSIRKRASFGVGAEYRSTYKAGDYKVPYILDLHAVVDYKITNSLTLFLQGGNLLNRSLQYIPMYARKGICVTGGIVLNL